MTLLQRIEKIATTFLRLAVQTEALYLQARSGQPVVLNTPIGLVNVTITPTPKAPS